ncbi:FKBP-type peptidyl-prolyl cis-trans isomerase [Sphingomonas naphthae]|uniref:Peptidyl-prolyl cis-trans isomerase n=1 Tax=Sphingomonas naphthae TaxID=1813468 RepID=A0ABY7TH83_9SPHN|nr:FKBP-type peptidyl-prolyl cis-trans isomerase [Sphingomonas naphthae]WCT72336.1 FKBP-type peptidyl-prolyl cis-trans isomerase [Sphingomonas naphthae]
MSEVTAVPLRPIKKGVLPMLWVGIAITLLLALAAAWTSTSKAVAMAQTPADFLAENGKRSGVVTTASGLQYEVLKPGKGPKPTAGDVALITYDGKLVSGETFDSSAKNGGPVPMPVSGVIPGFSEALQLMQADGKYRFWIPPALGYGDRAAGPIPANSVLVFDVGLIGFQPMPAGMPGMPGAGM